MGYKDRWLIPGKGKNGAYDKKGKLKAGYDMPEYYSVNHVRDWVKNDFGGSIVRFVKGKNEKLKSGEYLVAVRVAFTYKNDKRYYVPRKKYIVIHKKHILLIFIL